MTATTTITPYLFFGGRCEEALNYYQTALGAKVEGLMRFSDSPDPVPEGMLQPGFEHKVMHASATVGGARFMASDGSDDQSKFGGHSLALAVPTVAEAHRCFDGLADGGQVQMPLSKTFWSPCYGMVTDRFGLSWMVMLSPEACG